MSKLDVGSSNINILLLDKSALNVTISCSCPPEGMKASSKNSLPI